MKLCKRSFPALLLMLVLLGGPQAAVGQNVYATVHGTFLSVRGAVHCALASAISKSGLTRFSKFPFREDLCGSPRFFW